MFNAAFLSGPVATDAELTQRILLAGQCTFNARGLEWAYWVCEDWMEPRCARRSRHLLRTARTAPFRRTCRACTPNAFCRRESCCRQSRSARVAAATVRDAFCEIGSVCFHVPLTWFREVFDNDSVWDDFASYVGYVDGEPVSTTAVVTGAGVLGVYNVATLPGHQRKGYGEAVMRHAIDQAGAGESFCNRRRRV